MSDPQVIPQKIEAKIDLPNEKNVKVNSNAVKNKGVEISIENFIKSIKKAAKEEIFPPIATSQNGN